MEIRLLKNEKGRWRLEIEESSKDEENYLTEALLGVRNEARPPVEGDGITDCTVIQKLLDVCKLCDKALARLARGKKEAAHGA